MLILHPHNFSRIRFIIPLKIARRSLSTRRSAPYYMRAFMQIVGFIMTRDGYAYESPSFAGGYTLLIASLSTWVFSISRPLSSPFSRYFRQLLNFTIVVTVLAKPLEKPRDHLGKMVDIGLLIFRDNVA